MVCVILRIKEYASKHCSARERKTPAAATWHYRYNNATLNEFFVYKGPKCCKIFKFDKGLPNPASLTRHTHTHTRTHARTHLTVYTHAHAIKLDKMEINRSIIANHSTRGHPPTL